MPQIPDFRKIRRWYSGVLAFIAIACGQALLAQKLHTQAVDVAIRIYRLDGQGAAFLKDRDFYFPELQRDKVQVERFTAGPNNSPVYALLDLAHCAADPEPASPGLLAALNTMFALRWQVTLLYPGARQTAFLRSPQDLTAVPKAAGRTEVAAIESLNENIGRHIVFALCTDAGNVPSVVVAMSNQVQAPLFTFKAGAAVQSPAFELPAMSVPSPTNENGQTTSFFSSFGGLARSRYLPYLGPLDQPTLQDAIQTARQMSDQFFLLHLHNVPTEPSLRLNVHLPGGRDTKYRVIANAYAQNAAPPRIVLMP